MTAAAMSIFWKLTRSTGISDVDLEPLAEQLACDHLLGSPPNATTSAS